MRVLPGERGKNPFRLAKGFRLVRQAENHDVGGRRDGFGVGHRRSLPMLLWCGNARAVFPPCVQGGEGVTVVAEEDKVSRGRENAPPKNLPSRPARFPRRFDPSGDRARAAGREPPMHADGFDEHPRSSAVSKNCACSISLFLSIIPLAQNSTRFVTFARTEWRYRPAPTGSRSRTPDNLIPERRSSST